MQSLYLFGLASRHAQWASVRQAAISGNIANANTPGYKAVDTGAFEAELARGGPNLARTASGHLALPATDIAARTATAKAASGATASGNTVDIAREMLKAGEVNRAFSLDTAIVRSFHRMILASVK